MEPRKETKLIYVGKVPVGGWESRYCPVHDKDGYGRH